MSNGKIVTIKVRSTITLALPPDDESISKYISPKYIKKISLDSKMTSIASRAYITTAAGQETVQKSVGDTRFKEEVPTKRTVKFEER